MPVVITPTDMGIQGAFGITDIHLIEPEKKRLLGMIEGSRKSEIADAVPDETSTG